MKRSPDQRGVAINIDFLNAAILVIAATGIFLGVASQALGSLSTDNLAEEASATRVSDHLAEDVFIEDIDQTLLNRSCVDAYMQEQPTSKCWDSSFPTGGTDLYLAASNGISTRYDVNVTITSQTDQRDVQCPLTTCSIGPEPPLGRDVSVHQRVVAWRSPGGDIDYQTMYVYVWGQK